MKCRGPKDNGEYINGECQKCPVCGRGKGHSKVEICERYCMI